MSIFVAASPERQAAALAADRIHVWRLPYRHADGREPLRGLLAAYLDASPQSIRFASGMHGRPVLAEPDGDLDFNWSHSGGYALVALARRLPMLGIDLEIPRPRPRALQLALRYFHADEHAQLSALPPEQRDIAFLRLWTAKEAVLKALGEGLQFGLHRVVFRLEEGLPQAEHFDRDAGPLSAWNVLRLDDALGFACLAWQGSPREVRCFSLATS